MHPTHSLISSIHRRPAAAKMRGFTLIEVLITAIILAGGLLGVASLQSTGLLAGHTATLRTQAVILGNELADRMRANSSALADYAGDTGAGANKMCSGSSGTVCSAADLAADDRFRWDESVTAVFGNFLSTAGTPLPLTAVTVNTATTPATVTVTINWEERGTAQQYSRILRI